MAVSGAHVGWMDEATLADKITHGIYDLSMDQTQQTISFRLADLPIELTQEVVQHLTHDSKTLYALSLVNRQVGSLCTPVLYSAIKLRDSTMTRQHQLFTTLAESRDRLQLIRSLSVIIGPPHYSHGYLMYALLELLPSMSQLRDLAVLRTPSMDMDLYPTIKYLGKSSQIAAFLEENCGVVSPTLTSLQLEIPLPTGLFQPLDFQKGRIRLRSLELMYPYAVQSARDLVSPSLERLAINGDVVLLNNLFKVAYIDKEDATVTTFSPTHLYLDNHSTLPLWRSRMRLAGESMSGNTSLQLPDTSRLRSLEISSSLVDELANLDKRPTTALDTTPSSHSRFSSVTHLGIFSPPLAEPNYAIERRFLRMWSEETQTSSSNMVRILSNFPNLRSLSLQREDVGDWPDRVVDAVRRSGGPSSISLLPGMEDPLTTLLTLLRVTCPWLEVVLYRSHSSHASGMGVLDRESGRWNYQAIEDEECSRYWTTV